MSGLRTIPFTMGCARAVAGLWVLVNTASQIPVQTSITPILDYISWVYWLRRGIVMIKTPRKGVYIYISLMAGPCTMC